jgi:PAS domain S-box-containing protein
MYRRIFYSLGRPVTLIVLLYIIVGSLWILFSDKLVYSLFHDPEVLTRIQTYKGWFFVLGSGLLIYMLMSYLVKDLRAREKDLRDTKMLQKEFLNQHYQPLWKSDSMGNCIFNNEKWVAFSGSNISTEKPFAWLDNVHPDDKPFCIDRFTYGFIGKKTFEVEYRLLLHKQEYRWVLNTCTPYFNTSGQLNGFVGFYFDIQEKKQLQEKYKDSSRRYGYLFSNNPNPMLVYDTQDLRILEANNAALSLYGYSEQDFLSLTLSDLRPVSEIPALMEQVSEHLPEYHRSSGWIHKRKDGTLFDVEISAHSLPSYHSNGHSLRLVVIRDITDSIKAFRSAREGDRRFKAVFDNSPQGAIICGSDLRIDEINPVACSILEIGRQEAINMSLKIFLNSDYDPNAAQYVEKINLGLPLVGELNMVRTTGVEFRSSFNLIRFTENGITKLYFSFNDIDEKYKMQIALQESERINATLVTNLPGMVYRCMYDEAWTMTYVSFGVEKLTGYKPFELLYNQSITFEEIIHPDDREKVRKIFEKPINENQKFDLQYRIIAKDGVIKWVWEQARGIFDSNVDVLYIEGFVIDITREHEALEQVEFQSMFLELILNNIPFPLYYKDLNGIYTGCNKVFCEFLGREKSDIIGKSVFDIFERDQAQMFHEKDQALLSDGGSQIYETEVTFPDGRKMDAMFHKSVFQNLQNLHLGIIGIYFDITQRVKAEKVIKNQLEELERINNELERFSYTVSHDLRSPLVTIKGFLGLLKEDLAEQNMEQVQEDIMRIGNATDKMQQLLEDLLKLSRAGKMVEQKESFSMSQVAKEAEELLYGLLKGKKCEIVIEPDMPMVLAGKARIREIFQNLMENAVKFSIEKPNQWVKVYARNQDGNYVYCVEDNGMGIPEKYHEKIFGLFNKLDNNSSGTGLGLSLVKRIVENHNGRIWVESKAENEGSVFCFTLNTEKLTE